MEIPEKVAGVETARMIELFQSFLALDPGFQFDNGELSYNPKRVSVEFVANTLSISLEEASKIQAELVTEGWIDAAKLIPTRKGMGLSQHVDRPKLSRDQADAILAEVVAWAHRVNADPEARVTVRTMHLYGSLQRREEQVGDIDLFIEFTTLDLGDDMQPEDMEREEELSEELAAISEYLSPASQFDRGLMSDVPTTLVFPSTK